MATRGRAVAAVETRDAARWARRFASILEGFQFLPGGRILAGAGTAHRSTLFNCFVMGPIEDSLAGIFERLKESALTLQWGGGIGCDFSTLRPKGSPAQASGMVASGPVSFMHVWDAMCGTVSFRGLRRGAMMGSLRCDHPDIERFIDAKRSPGALTHFNLSVQVSDALMRAVLRDEDWPLRFPCADSRDPGEPRARLAACSLWRHLAEAAHASAEPGVLFVDRINELNNLYYREQIKTTNPCGEVPLPAFGACDLGSINVVSFVREPFSRRASLDFDRMASVAGDATRFLDNVVDLARFPLAAQEAEVRATRRLGLGITGLADALIMLGQHYDSDAGRETARRVLATLRDAAYATSISLAREKGAFEAFDREAHLQGRYIGGLSSALRDGIASNGIRNSHLLAIAPAGSISVLANNVSSGVEPVFALEMERLVVGREGREGKHRIADHSYVQWRRVAARSAPLPKAFVTAQELSVEAHLRMQAVLQPLVDNSIAKTVNLPADVTPAEIERVYSRAYELGLKGCTVFRPNTTTGAVLERSSCAVRTRRAHCEPADERAEPELRRKKKGRRL